MKLPMPGVVVIQEVGPKTYPQSIPFHVRLRLAADTVYHKANLTMDPRLAFTDTGAKLIAGSLDSALYQSITSNQLEATARIVVNKLQDIHHKGELEALDRPHLQTRPLWKHDCDACVFLGSSEEHDFYFCKQGNGVHPPTLIARYGSNGPQYISGVSFAHHDEWIWRAAVLAEAKGLGEFLKGHHTILIDDKVPFSGRW